MARPRVRDNITHAAVTESTYRKAKIDREPPVAATTAMMSAVARIWLSPGMRPDGTNGASARRTRETPSRAQANPWSGPPTVSAFTTSLHYGDQTEDRKVHRDHEATDDDAQKDDHDRLEQRRERRDRGIDLVIVEVGDFREHLVERAGVLADADHVHDHGREDGASLERLGERPAGGDGGPRLHDRPLDDAVAGRTRGDEQTFQDRNAGGDERAERPGEARDGDLANQHADDRHFQQKRVDHVAALIGVVVALERVDRAGAHAHHDEHVLLRELRDVHDDFRGQREIGAETLEHLGEGGDDEDHHEHDDQHRHADDRDGVDHGPLHLALELGGLLDVARQTLEDDV